MHRPPPGFSTSRGGSRNRSGAKHIMLFVLFLNHLFIQDKPLHVLISIHAEAVRQVFVLGEVRKLHLFAHQCYFSMSPIFCCTTVTTKLIYQLFNRIAPARCTSTTIIGILFFNGIARVPPELNNPLFSS